MLTYSVVVAQDNKDYTDEELVVQTYSNYDAANNHQEFIEANKLLIDGWVWDYVFIRETRVADVFEKEGV